MENYIATLLHWEVLRHRVEAGQVAVEADQPGDYQVATLHIVFEYHVTGPWTVWG